MKFVYVHVYVYDYVYVEPADHSQGRSRLTPLAWIPTWEFWANILVNRHASARC